MVILQIDIYEVFSIRVTLVHVSKFLSGADEVLLFSFLSGRIYQVVKNVVSPFLLALGGHSALFQKVVTDSGAVYLAALEKDLNKLSETGTVVVPDCLSVAKRLKHRVCAENPFFDVLTNKFGYLRRCGF